MWTFALQYKAVVVWVCMAAKTTGISLECDCFLMIFDVLSGIWCAFDVVCFLLEGLACLLGHALL